MNKAVYIIGLLGCFWSCSNAGGGLERALEQGGSNRPELEKVLPLYAGDTLKLKVARFLIENMPG